MAYPVYTVPDGDTLPIFFDSFDGGTGASITMTGLATGDVLIYKDGSPTQRTSANGVTLLDTDGIDFDGITGVHGFSIDLSDNSDDGFYAVGSWFHVIVSGITIDSQTLRFIAAAFRIVPAEASAGVPDVNIASTDDIDLSATQKASVNTEADTAFTTQMADSVASDGTIATREQAMYATYQFLTEFAISGTTMTVKKVDGSTTLFTLTLDDDTTPTSLTRS